MSKQKYLQELEKLDEKILERLVEVSKNEKAKSYFTSSIKFNLLKGYLVGKNMMSKL